MIFLKKLFRRAAVSEKRSGQMSIWLALGFSVFLALYLVCLESVRMQSARRQAEQAAESGLFSLFSEYEPHLLKEYSLFALDTSFRSGTENMDEICAHLWKFTELNTADAEGKAQEGLALQGVSVKDPVRLTDGQGAVFYRQAVQVIKEETGLSLAEDWIFDEAFQQKLEDDSRSFQEDCEMYEGSVVDYEYEEGEEEMSSEAENWDGMWNRFTLQQVMDQPDAISQKEILLEQVPSHRTLSRGTGAELGTEDTVLNKQLFVSYLCEYMRHAADMAEESENDRYLDYELEYICQGNASDAQNLEETVRSILLLREGVNYGYLLTDEEAKAKAELLAVVLAAVTGNEALVKGVKHLILLGWAYGESLVEVRQLLKGQEVVLVKTKEDWQVPLSGIIALMGNPGAYDEQKTEQKGMSYESFLRLFLTIQSSETLAMRGLDIIEGQLQKNAGCERIHVDHCIDQLTAQIWMDSLQMERSYRYE